MMYTNSVTTKGQVTIPKYLRDVIGLKAGSLARISLMNDKTIIITAPISVEELREKVGPPSNSQKLTFKEEQRLHARGLIN